MRAWLGFGRAAMVVAAVAATQALARPAFAETPGCSVGTPQVCMTVDRCMAWDYHLGVTGVSRTCSQIYTQTYWWAPLDGSGDGDDVERSIE